MANHKLAGLVLVALAVGLAAAACGDDGPVTGPSPIPEQQASSGPVRGGVYDTALRPLAGALVEALDGPRAGTTTNADPTGRFEFPGIFDDATRFQASMDGHVAAVATVNPRNASRWINFYLALPEGAVNIAGEYTLTITADSTCTDLPAEVRTRVYTAIATPSIWSRTFYEVLLSGPSLLGRYNPSHRSTIAVAGEYVAIQFGGEQPALVEQLSPTSYVAFSAVASASTGVAAGSIATSFSGFIDYCEMPTAEDIPMDVHDYRCDPPAAVAHVRCESQGHRLSLTRR